MPKILYFFSGLAVGLAILCAYVIANRMDLFSVRPDRTVVYKSADGVELSLHVFNSRLAVSERGAPALMLFHGGGWQYGSPTAFYPQCQYFAQQGLACISVQYRITSVHETDARAAVQDARDAMAFLRRNAKSLGIDPQRVAAGGGSAGGHLAAALGTAVPLAGENAGLEVRPKALVLYNPMLDLSPGTPDYHLVADFWKTISPIHHIDESVPDSLILVGDKDLEVPVKTVQEYCDIVHQQGKLCELEVYPGERHGFFNKGVKGDVHFHKTNARVLKFLLDVGLSDQS